MDVQNNAIGNWFGFLMDTSLPTKLFFLRLKSKIENRAVIFFILMLHLKVVQNQDLFILEGTSI